MFVEHIRGGGGGNPTPSTKARSWALGEMVEFRAIAMDVLASSWASLEEAGPEDLDEPSRTAEVVRLVDDEGEECERITILDYLIARRSAARLA